MEDLLLSIINYIISHNLAQTKDVDIFKDYSPIEPDHCTIVYEYGGSASAPFTDVSVRSIQIVVRDKSSQVAKTASWKLLKLFQAPTQIMQIGQRTCIVTTRNTPIKLGVDEQNRYLYAFNLGITTNFD